MSRSSKLIGMAALLTATWLAALRRRAAGLISIIVTDPANPYWLTEGKVAEAEAKKLGYTATVGAHKGDTNTESTLIDTAITNKAVAIILDPANASGSLGAVKNAIAAGIPVFSSTRRSTRRASPRRSSSPTTRRARRWARNNGSKTRAKRAITSSCRRALRQQRRHPLQRLRDCAEPVPRSQEGRQSSRQLGPYPGPRQDAVDASGEPQHHGRDRRQRRNGFGRHCGAEGGGQASSVKVGGFDGSPDSVAAIKSASCNIPCCSRSQCSRPRRGRADSFLKTGKTGASSEKQLFDCLLITKDNTDKYTGPFTLSQ